MIPCIKSPLLRQYVVVITVNLCLVVVGLGLSWPSPVLVKLRDEDQTVLDRPITEHEGSWIVSIGFLVAIPGTFLPALLLDRLGRKLCILLVAAPRIVVWLLFTFANDLWMLLLGRAINGFCDMLIFTIVQVYASEIASTKIRGALGTILQVMCSLGNVTMLSVGPFLSYITLNASVTAFTIAAFVPLLFLPESPYHLYRKGKKAEAVKVLTFLRGSEALASEEMKEYELNKPEVGAKKRDLFKKKPFLRALGIVCVFAFGGQLVGHNAISMYLQTVLESTNTSVPPEIASAIIGVIQLISAISSSIVTDKLGRKLILIVTLIGMMFGMAGLGAFFKVQETNDEIYGIMNFLPLASLIVVVFCYNAGPGCVNWVLSAELFDGPSRAVGLAFSSVLGMALIFLSTRYFANLVNAVGPAISYWIFSGNCLLFCLFIVFCVPETKGKTFAEIQVALGGTPDYAYGEELPPVEKEKIKEK